MIEELGWVTLEQWYKRNKLIQLYKIINGYTPGAQRDASNISIYTTNNPASPDATIIPTLSYLPPILPTSYQASFFYRTIKDWNDLPLNFYGIPTLSIFNSIINAHINDCNNTI